MAIYLGVRPGGRNRFSISVLFWTGRLPARLVVTDSLSGVRMVLDRTLGVVGEWGELDAVAMAAPLTWSGSASGEREAEVLVRQRSPDWVPRHWFRPPNALPGAVAIQGPALTWALALEAKRGNLPEHQVVETHPRASLARTARDLRADVLGYSRRDKTTQEAQAHIDTLVSRFVDAGILVIDDGVPTQAEELEALICAITALAVAHPDTGLVTTVYDGADIRPVGRRSLAILDALP